MRKLALPDSPYYRYWLVSLTVVFTIFIVLLSDTRYSVAAMLKLELAQTQHYFYWVKADYNYPATLLQTYLYFDFAFIAAFTSLFCLSLLVVSDILNKRANKLLLSLCFLPGILDVVENVLMLQMLQQNGISDQKFDVFVAVVATKWIIVVPFILLSLAVLVYPIFQQKIDRYRSRLS